MNKTIGILAHVDAGKTTFSERVLFDFGAIRSLGRVDHQNSFMDSNHIERERGITIFSDQAVFDMDGDTIFWLDTPGHVDFSAEMERAVSAMDYAIVLISCAEGIQSHTLTVWEILEKRGVPVFFFINKIDRAGADRDAVLSDMREKLTSDIVFMDGFSNDNISDGISEAVAERDEKLLDRYLSGGFDKKLWLDKLIDMIRERRIFPVFSGAALTGVNVSEFMAAVSALTRTDYDKRVSEPFSAKVYKVRHDSQGARICFFKALSGTIAARDDIGGYKVNEIRRYHGSRFKVIPKAEAGELCAVIGLPEFKPGDIIGAVSSGKQPSVEPMLQSTVEYDNSVREGDVLKALKELEDEDPTLSVSLDRTGISISVMGGIQLEILKQLMLERYGLNVSFGKRRVLFMETIAKPAIGIGHFEPLRHYAEVHLRLIPMPRGSGISFESVCHVDTLPLSWQKLIETHVFEKKHKGVLTGAPITDIRVQLIIGRHHLKHTEGGDFREATYRAIRCALMNAESVLLEPVCRFVLRAPEDMYGRITGDLLKMRAKSDSPYYSKGFFTVEGLAAFREIAEYLPQLTAITHGKGYITYRLNHYEPVRDYEEIMSGIDYNPYTDDSPDSVFCKKGAGYYVNWKDVPMHAHCPQDYRD